MTQRNPKSNEPVAILADYAFEEVDFPKQSDNFDEVSRFLEESASFAFSMSDRKFYNEVSHLTLVKN